MNYRKINQQSATSLNKNDLHFDDFPKQKNHQELEGIDPMTPIPKNQKKYTFINPFLSNQSLDEQSQEHFQQKIVKQNNPILNQISTPFINQVSLQQNQNQPKEEQFNFFNKHASFEFPLQSKQQQQKNEMQFQFYGEMSGSLFSSQKTQENKQKLDKFKNLQNYKKLLKEHYNEWYMKSNFHLIRRSTFGKSIRGSDLSSFITRQPILFYKKFYGSRSGYDLSGNFLCRLIGNKIYYKNVQNEQLQNIDEIKCECIELPQKQSISPSLQIDSNSMHLFYYSNTTNEIVIVSLIKAQKNMESEICRVKVRTQRTNPLLSLIQINKQIILLLIGGYNPINVNFNLQDVQGCKYIEIFPVDKWGTQILQSRVIKLINGKIYPLIIFPVKIENNQSLLLIGGNTMAKLSGNTNKLSFKQNKILNRSSNFRAVYINTKQIIQCIEQSKDIMSLPNSNNISLQIQQKVNLYKGYVDYVRSAQKEKIRMFLPKMREFYSLKILKKQLRVIKTNDIQQRLLTFAPNDEYHHLEMKCFKKPMTKYYEINSKGIFKEKVIQLSNTNSGIMKQMRCPCQFM